MTNKVLTIKENSIKHTYDYKTYRNRTLSIKANC